MIIKKMIEENIPALTNSTDKKKNLTSFQTKRFLFIWFCIYQGKKQSRIRALTFLSESKKKKKMME